MIRSRRQVLRGGLALTGLGLLAGCDRSRLPWQPAAVPRVGFLFGSSAAATGDLREAFLQGLADHGYREGRDVAVEWRFADGSVERMPALAAELATLPVAVVVTPSTGDAAMVKQAAGTIPIVVAGASGDLVEDELAASYARPGGNVTGLGNPPEVIGKAIQLLTQAAPGISRLAFLRQGGRDPNLRTFSLDSLEEFARRLGVRIQFLNVGRPEELEPAFAAATAERADALYISNTPVLSANRAKIVAFAAAQRLPAMYGRRVYVEDGGLMCYWPRVPDLVRRSAYFVDRILKGTSPADLPIEQASTFDFVINLKTARAMALSIPQSVFAEVTEVIQ